MNKISIVVPVYNAEKYLRECIDSCLKQTYQNYEIILVNDGSTDGSLKIIEHYWNLHPDKIKYISKPNGGTASALNAGINIMTGEWFKWLSADDVLFSNALELFIKNSKSVRNRHLTLFYTDYVIIDQKSRLIKTFEEPKRTKPQNLQAVDLFHNFFGNGTTSFMSKHLIEMVGLFDETLPFNEDYDYWLRCTLMYSLPMHHLPFVSAQYRVHSDSLTIKKNYDQNLATVDLIRNNYREFLTTEQLIYLETIKPPLKKRLAYRLPKPILNIILRLRKL